MKIGTTDAHRTDLDEGFSWRGWLIEIGNLAQPEIFWAVKMDSVHGVSVKESKKNGRPGF